jgi:hypothetical protein
MILFGLSTRSRYSSSTKNSFLYLEQILSQIHKKLTDAFDVFDGDKTRTVDLK